MKIFILFSVVNFMAYIAGAEPRTNMVAQILKNQLVGGVETNLRAEVGRFRGCTATLIHKRFIITAAHCLNYPDYTDTTVRVNDSFRTKGENGTDYVFGVDKIYSFARFRYERTINKGFTSDLALIRLSSAVPKFVARAANISDVIPAKNQLMTIFGYGCKDRATKTGGGKKQFIEFLYTKNTQALCPGDSGGPLFTKGRNAKGPLVGVNSDYSGNGPFPTWNDIFADAVGLKLQILAVMQKWEGGNKLQGIGYFGNNYLYAEVINAKKCFRMCSKDSRCKAYTFVRRRGAANLCFLKNRVSGFKACDNCKSGLAPKKERNRIRNGRTYRAFYLPNNNPDTCIAACAKDNKCKTYTFRKKTQKRKARCWLKNSVPRQTVASGFIAGTKRGIEWNTNRPGKNFKVFANVFLNTCKRACSRRAKCRSFSFKPRFNSRGTCRLKNSVPNPRKVRHLASAVKRGLEVGYDRPGSDYKKFNINGYKPELCQAICAREKKCKAYTFVAANIQGSTSKCWLKNSVPKKVKRANMVSGFDGAQFF